MKLFLHEISELGTEIQFSDKDKWAMDCVCSVDERSDGQPVLSSRPLQGDLTLRRVDGVVVVQGNMTTEVQLICSRCAAPYRMKCAPAISALYCRDPQMAGIAHIETDKQGRATGKVAGKLSGHARHAHDFAGDGQVNQDLDITYLAEDEIDLSTILLEHLQLQIPFQPLCNEACKGICANCGADQNRGRCACAKIQPTSPFSALKNLRLGASKN
ncbi:DUF177 domain-containing protein [bacterium]|nr:DUF177 domain-containing protein [bacterium]